MNDGLFQSHCFPDVGGQLRSYFLLILLLFCSCFAQPIAAADIKVATGIDSKSNVVFVNGTFLPDDNKRFIQQTIGLDKAIIVFNSLGGNLLAGIEIGKAIRLKDFATYVAQDSYCASACALAWLGGTKRFM